MTRQTLLLSMVGMSPEEGMRVADQGMRAGLLQPDAVQLQDWLGDAGRILVIVNAADLPQFGNVFVSLLASPVLTDLICVAVGPPADPGQLVVPSVLGASASPVIWWEINSARTGPCPPQRVPDLTADRTACSS